MDRGNLVAEICRIQDLPEDIRNKLESSPGTVFPYEDRLITLISGKVYSFPDDEDGRTVAGAVEARQAAVSQQPASAADIYHRILTDSHYQPLPSVIRQSHVGQVGLLFTSFSMATTRPVLFIVRPPSVPPGL